ncbi:hypothetical protein BJ138DRAFT_1113474 [Hygrophoropsis aurantiaca]|uniref:Uncharacterized protein n=1 Tax=Hygrophoropsis aurantiaca TaxID=72124 RepID=A0ACB8ACB9_9AGAM|nr:hypothetical protein BJ138DRAFT_1113474 [Hygrophoropsis aurantiaca]
MSTLSLGVVTITALFAEAVLYGIFACLSIIAVYVLFKRRTVNLKLNKPMLTGCLAMFIVATAHVSANFGRVFHTFQTSSNPSEEFALTDAPWYIANTAIFPFQILLGDMMMLYRLHLVWNGDLRVMVPGSLCVLGSAAAVIGTLTLVCSASSPTAAFHLQRWALSYFGLTLSYNICGAVSIAYRILLAHKRLQKAGANMDVRSMIPAAAMIIESASVYSAMWLVFLPLYLSGNYMVYIFLQSLVPVVGITFSLIIVRVGLSSETSHQRMSHSTTIAFAPSVPKPAHASTSFIDNQNVSNDLESESRGDIDLPLWPSIAGHKGSSAVSV